MNKFNLKGIYTLTHLDKNGLVISEETFSNLVVNQGLDHVLDVVFNAGSQVSNWYIGLFKNNYTPLATDTASNFPTAVAADEVTTEYSEAARPAFTGVIANQAVTNHASLAEFTFTSSVTVYGAFLISDSAKSGTSGILFSAGKFPTPKAMANGETLQVKYTLTASSA